jgi:ferric-dicitrate binding protein FerR (iron transport regulator)
MTPAHTTRPRRRRSREWMRIVGVVVLAAGSGLLAAQLGTHRPWENSPKTSSTSTSTSTVDPQRNP